MNVDKKFDIFKARLKEIGTTLLKFNFLPLIIYCCCILHKILVASKDWILDQIAIHFHFSPIDNKNLLRNFFYFFIIKFAFKMPTT